MKLKLFSALKRISYLFLVAWMLGVSNIILEETRMVHETRVTIEQQEGVLESDLDKSKDFKFS